MLDQRWHLIAGIELFPDLPDAVFTHRGEVRARAHHSGWFISVHHHPSLTEEEVAHLTEFAKVRTYLLLTEGPTADTWTPSTSKDDWIAYWDVDELDLAASIPDAVPAHWAW